MYDFDFKLTDHGCVGVMPTGEEHEFSSPSEYAKAYEEEENEIYDFMAECSSDYDYPEDWDLSA